MTEVFAVQKNIVTRQRAESVRQNRQTRFGIRAFHNRKNVDVEKKSSYERQTKPSSTHIYGPERLRLGTIDRSERTTRRAARRQQASGSYMSRRVTSRYGTTSYKKRVRDLKGTDFSSAEEMHESYIRNKTNPFDLSE